MQTGTAPDLLGPAPHRQLFPAAPRPFCGVGHRSPAWGEARSAPEAAKSRELTFRRPNRPSLQGRRKLRRRPAVSIAWGLSVALVSDRKSVQTPFLREQRNSRRAVRNQPFGTKRRNASSPHIGKNSPGAAKLFSILGTETRK